MDELRSAEILDREILEDARKKAESALLDADEECKKILASVDAKVQAAQKEKETEYSKKIALFIRDREAILPLEKKRYLVSFEDSAVINALNDYLKSLSSEKRLDLLKNLLSGFALIIKEKKLKAVAFGIAVEDAQNILESAFGTSVPCTQIAFEKTGETAVDGIEIREGIIIEAEDGSIRIRATLDEVILELLDTYRYELTSAIFGGRLPE